MIKLQRLIKKKVKYHYLQKIKQYLKKQRVNKLRRDLINAGIIDVLLQIFAKRDLDDITYPFTNAFFVFTYPSNLALCQLLVEKQPFPSLLRLLDHKVEDIINDVISSIDNIFYYAAIGTEITKQHPFYTNLALAGGIEKIYSLFQQSSDKFYKKISAICLGIVFRAQEINDSSMRKEVITYLKSMYEDSREDIRKLVRFSLQCVIAQKQEIESDHFVILE
ncbi:MAG: hypothetical protein EZS28_042039 [Streblomastix strix]|uniref:Uncharacterized protein n=1 Tax=Streblomastix strix TaxID=222440 RepID=A0A5J4TVZ0_9EUKA|nr:MAG: hypothetical protein EZS28_042039 [Streblomastix strix]